MSHPSSNERRPVQPSSLRFVIAEDEHDLRFVIERLIAEAYPSAKIAAYANGKDALDDFEQHGADLVISNHCMPIMDGPTLVRGLRRRSRELPILMVSGSPEAREEGQAAGISLFLDKDELTSGLVASVRRLLGPA